MYCWTTDKKARVASRMSMDSQVSAGAGKAMQGVEWGRWKVELDGDGGWGEGGPCLGGVGSVVEVYAKS